MKRSRDYVGKLFKPHRSTRLGEYYYVIRKYYSKSLRRHYLEVASYANSKYLENKYETDTWSCTLEWLEINTTEVKLRNIALFKLIIYNE